MNYETRVDTTDTEDGIVMHGDDAADEVPAVDDPHFWSKLCPERAAAPDPFLDRAARRRRAAVIDQASGMQIAA